MRTGARIQTLAPCCVVGYGRGFATATGRITGDSQGARLDQFIVQGSQLRFLFGCQPAGMVRTQVYIPGDVYEYLKNRSKSTGLAMVEQIRQALREYLEREEGVVLREDDPI